jgi:hypothetical protein
MSKTEKIYQLIQSGDRVKFFRKQKGSNQRLAAANSISDYQIPLKFTFTDEQGMSRTIRYLSQSNTIYQDEQIKNGFLANIKLTSRDRADLKFKGGFLIAKKKNVQDFLDTCPCNEAFVGDRDGAMILFREFKPAEGKKENISRAYNQAKAVIAMKEFSESEIDKKLIEIFGSLLKLPKERQDKEELMIAAINDTPSALDIILKENKTDEVMITIGLAINNDVLSFIKNPEYVMLKRVDEWEQLRRVSRDNSEQQKVALFADFLQSTEGKTTLEVIANLVEAKTKVEDEKLPEEKIEELKKVEEKKVENKKEEGSKK